jgi:hypothetical protein
MPDLIRFAAHVDDRGSLLPIELATIPFDVQRVFVVHGSTPATERGGHFADCEQILVLLSGTASVRHGSDRAAPTTTELLTPGDAVMLGEDDYIVYNLRDEHSSILVLASSSFSGHPERSS